MHLLEMNSQERLLFISTLVQNKLRSGSMISVALPEMCSWGGGGFFDYIGSNLGVFSGVFWFRSGSLRVVFAVFLCLWVRGGLQGVLPVIQGWFGLSGLPVSLFCQSFLLWFKYGVLVLCEASFGSVDSRQVGDRGLSKS